ncbi:MAG: hypothetical protein ABH827_02755 [bacterium]
MKNGFVVRQVLVRQVLCVLGFIFMLPALKADLTAQVGSLTKSLTVLKGKYVSLAEKFGEVRGELAGFLGRRVLERRRK